jgi:hypothetical protein
MATQLSLLADAGHVIAAIADGAQHAAVFGRQGACLALGEILSSQQHGL